MNRTTGFGFGGVEVTAGLLHDIGRVIRYVKCPGDVTDAAPTRAPGDDVLAAERARFGIDHCAAGYQFAQQNGLPEHLVRTILNHHRPEDDQCHPNLVALVALANRLANYAQVRHNIADYNLSACPIFRVMARRWTAQREGAFAAALPGIVVRALKNTRLMLKSFE